MLSASARTGRRWIRKWVQPSGRPHAGAQELRGGLRLAVPGTAQALRHARCIRLEMASRGVLEVPERHGQGAGWQQIRRTHAWLVATCVIAAVTLSVAVTMLLQRASCSRC